MTTPLRELVELKPCPFCGGPAENVGHPRIGCSNHECPASVIGTTAEAWNRRVSATAGEVEEPTVYYGTLEGRAGGAWVHESNYVALALRHAAEHAALVELVACKDLKDHLEAFNQGARYTPRVIAVREEYERRNYPAWVAARAVLKGTTAVEQLDIPAFLRGKCQRMLSDGRCSYPHCMCNAV